MSKTEVKVYIDSNEAEMSPETTEKIIMHEDVKDFIIEPMEWGDYRVGDCVFERKTPNDFAASIEDGRMREQVEGMARMDAQTEEGVGVDAHLLIEGTMGDLSNLENTNLPPKSMRGMVASIIQRNNIPVTFCDEGKYVADMVVRLGRKEIEDDPTVQATGAATDFSFMEQVFMSIEGVGPKTATSLSEEWGSLTEALKTKEEDFTSVSGVGQKTAKTIYETLNSDHGTYDEDSDVSNDVTTYRV